jgi:polyphosphate glucokinase
MRVLGIDIGGTGIKGAVVDVNKGKLVTERYRLLTPQPAKPAKVARVVANIAEQFQWKGMIGCTFPAVIRHGVVRTAANVDRAWVNKDGRALLQKSTGCRVVLLNDADAAGLAEMRFGAGRGEKGFVIMLTLGTGIGSGLFFNGRLIPNAELGHLEMRGKDAEQRISDRVRQDKGWNWVQFAQHLEEYLCCVEALLRPDLFIIGGGISKAHDKYLPLMHVDTRIVPARFLNEAGIIGAAIAAYRGEGE